MNGKERWRGCERRGGDVVKGEGVDRAGGKESGGFELKEGREALLGFDGREWVSKIN